MKWREIARKALTGNSLIGDRTKIKVDDIIRLYPDGIGLTGITIVEYAETSYPAFTFAEDPTKYFSGGIALRHMANVLLEASEGDLSAVNEEWSAHPFRIKMSKVTTKNGNTFTKVTDVKDEPNCDPETGEVIDSETAPF